MKLTKLLERLDYKVVAGSDNIEITELVNREVCSYASAVLFQTVISM